MSFSEVALFVGLGAVVGFAGGLFAIGGALIAIEGAVMHGRAETVATLTQSAEVLGSVKRRGHFVLGRISNDKSAYRP